MNTAQVIQFPTPDPQSQEASKNMYSDRFKKGYVMSSRLYRDEVRPFLTDAAKNVYAELEDWINGQLKETDHVSHRQLQGGKLKGSGKLGSATVSNAIKELIWFGVISVVEKNNKIGNKYQINEVSLVHYFDEFSASLIKALRISNESASIDEALLKVKRHASIGDTEKPSSAFVSDASIDSSLDFSEDDDKAETSKKFQPQNRQLNFIEYHTDDRTQISFPELCKKYPAQLDFQDQAKASFPDHSPNRIFENLKKMAQWSLDKSNHTPQKWMTIWLDTFMKNMPSDSELAAAEARKKQKSQSQTPKAEKPKRVSRFGKYLKPQQPQQGEIYDV